jgi:hypothetical protein
MMILMVLMAMVEGCALFLTWLQFVAKNGCHRLPPRCADSESESESESARGAHELKELCFLIRN